jgi:two-component system phosphate regulon sensor histidine kinase PhoR
MTRTIRWQLTISFFVVFLLLILGWQFYFLSIIRQSFINIDEENAVAQLRLIENKFAIEKENYSFQDFARNIIDVFGEMEARENLFIILPDGQLIGNGEGEENWSDPYMRPEVSEALLSEHGMDIRYSETRTANILFVCLSVDSLTEPRGVICVSRTIDTIDNRIMELNLGFWFGIGILGVAVAVIIARLNQRIGRPVDELTHIVEDVLNDATIPHIIVDKPVSVEVERLSQSIDRIIHQQQNAIDTLITDQGKLSAVLAIMTDGVIIADQEGRIVLINPAGENLFNIKEKNAISRSLIHVIRHHKFIDIWRKCQETQSEQTVSLEIPQGGQFIQCVATPLGQALPGHTLLLFQDFTRIRRLETVRQDFVSNISHELKTPLASLKALAETLHDSALDDPPTARHFLRRIDIEVDALSQMVAELIELVRIESGRAPLNLVSSSPVGIFQQAFERLKIQADRANLEMFFDFPEDLPNIQADQTRLEQALVNLIHNAIKFTPIGGKIELIVYQDADSVLFKIKDNGIGIPAEDVPRVFERFYKTDRARSGGGMGLGLAITKHIIEAHEGEVWVESVEGKGSSFYISVPIVKANS